MSFDPTDIPVGVPLDRFIKQQQEGHPHATGELSQILRDIALASKTVNLAISKSGLNGLEGAAGAVNVQGEDQQKLDILANKAFIKAFKYGGEVCAIISEENEELIDLKNNDGKYVIAMDPLDGSSNIDVNVSIGSIYSIYKRKSTAGGPVTSEDLLQPGSEQIAAGYTLYGSSCMLVFTTGEGVNGFTYEPSLGEFFLSHPQIKIPQSETYFSINEGAENHFFEHTNRFLSYCKQSGISARYIGSLVADFHRNLLKGGIYVYPATKAKMEGKLRLCYECNALAFIAEQAGGSASDGKNRILEIKPKSFHQKSPLYIGSTDLVNHAIADQ